MNVHSQLVDIGMEYPVHEADTRALVGVLVWQLDVDLPQSADERCLDRALEADVELLPVRRSVTEAGRRIASLAGMTNTMREISQYVVVAVAVCVPRQISRKVDAYCCR